MSILASSELVMADGSTGSLTKNSECQAEESVREQEL
jgi:hypothetical protein